MLRAVKPQQHDMIGSKSVNPVFPPMEINGTTIQPRKSTMEDVGAIHALIEEEAQASPKILYRDPDHIGQWVSHGVSFVAVDVKSGKIVGHVALDEWGTRTKEICAAVVKKEYQSRGLYGKMHGAVIEGIFASDPSAVIVSVKESKSNGLKLKEATGFVEVPIADAEKLGVVLHEPGEGKWRAFILTSDAYAVATAARNGTISGVVHDHEPSALFAAVARPVDYAITPGTCDK